MECVLLILLSSLVQGATLTVGHWANMPTWPKPWTQQRAETPSSWRPGATASEEVPLDGRSLHIVGADAQSVQISASFVLENGASLVLEELSLQGDADLGESTDSTLEIIAARLTPSAGFNAVSATASEVTLSDSEVQGGVYALSLFGGSATVQNSQLFETSIQAQDAESLEIWDSWIQDSPGAAVHTSGVLWVDVQGSSFVDNQGGVSLIECTDFQVADSLFQGNQGNQGGALYVDAAAGLATGLSFVGNSAEQGGAAHIAETSGAVTLSESAFEGNSATTGGGLHVASESAELVLQDLTFKSNQAQDGGAVWGPSTVVLSRASLHSNSASNQAGGVYGLAVHSSEFFENSAVDGGAYVGQELQQSWLVANVASNNGGGAMALDGVLDVQGSTLSSNRAEAGSGGGIYAYAGAAPSLTLSASRLLNNSACADGGGLWVDLALRVEMQDLHIDGNHADLCAVSARLSARSPQD